MKRIRYLGLGAAMVLALIAFPAGASASGGIEADSYPAEITAGPTVESTFNRLGEAGVVTCSQGPYFYGDQLTGPTDTAAMSVDSNWICGEGKSKLVANGCKFEFHPGSENSFDIGPPGCGPITGLAFSGSCIVSIGAQVGMPASFENVVTSGHERIAISVATNLKYVRETGTCQKEGTAQFTGQWEVVGGDGFGNPVDIRATDAFNGFFVANNQFEAEKFPISLAGQQEAGNPFLLTLSGGKISCATAQFSSEATKATSSLSVGATLSGCAVIGGSAVTVNMHSCYFTQSVSSFPFGKLGIGCAKEGDSIEFIWPNCTATFAAQSPVNLASYQNLGSGTERSVHVSDKAEGLSYTYVAGICQFLGKKQTNGALSVGYTLSEA